MRFRLLICLLPLLLPVCGLPAQADTVTYEDRVYVFPPAAQEAALLTLQVQGMTYDPQTLEPLGVQALEGAVFGIYAQDASGAYIAYPDPADPTAPLRIVTEDRPVEIALPLSVDLYLRQETVPQGYEEDADKPEYFSLSLPQTIAYVNRSLDAQGVFVVLAGDGELGPEPLADIPLVLEGMGAQYILRTDAEGRASAAGLTPGAYVLRQEETGAGYHVDTPEITLEVRSGEPTHVEIQNSRDGLLTLRPMGLTMDGQGQTRLVPTARAYAVYGPQGEYRGTLRAGETMALSASQQGIAYTLRAAETVDDGFSEDTQTHSVLLFSGRTAVCGPIVRSDSGFFTLRHRDALTGETVPGGDFALVDAQGVVRLAFAADAAGAYTADTPLKAGRYTLRMEQAADGYVYSAATAEIDIRPYLDEQAVSEAAFESAAVPAAYTHPQVSVDTQTLPSLFDEDATVAFVLRAFEETSELLTEGPRYTYELPEVAGLSVTDAWESGATLHIGRRFELPGVEEVTEITITGVLSYSYAYPAAADGTLRKEIVQAPFEVTAATFSPSAARDQYGSYGHVYDENSRAMQGISVSLGEETVWTDAFGAYAFDAAGEIAVHAPQGYGVKILQDRAYILPLRTVTGHVLTHGGLQGYPVSLSVDDLSPVTPDALGAFSITGIFDEESPLQVQTPQDVLWHVEQTDGQMTVHLYAAAAISGTAVDPDGRPVAEMAVRLQGTRQTYTTQTDAQGQYRFDSLYPDTYTLICTAPAGYILNEEAVRTCVLEAGEAVSLPPVSAMQPASVSGQLLDGETGYPGVAVTLEPTGRTTVTDEEGRFAFTGLPVGTYTPVFALAEDAILLDDVTALEITRPAQHADITVHTARPASISGRIWSDDNDDGLLSSGEYGLEGVVIALEQESAGILQTVTTQQQGLFELEGLVPGTYRIHVTLPEGMIFSREAQGVERLASGIDGETAESPWYTVASGQKLTGLMAGATQGGSVSGVLWEDFDGNDTLDIAETGFAQAEVTLLDAAGQTVGQAQTDDSGAFRFDSLRTGNYRVLIQLPQDHLFSKQEREGTEAGMPAELRHGRMDVTIRAGVQRAATLAGHVRFDQDTAARTTRKGYEGMAVALYEADSRSVPLAQTQTDKEGNFLFPLVRPGEYVLCYTLPAEGGDWGFTTQMDRETEGRGWTALFTLAYGASAEAETVGITRLGSIGGVAFEDANYSGLREEAEAGLTVHIALLSSDGTVLRETETAADGTYRFDGLPAGLYIVECTLPKAYAFTLNRMDAPSFNSDIPQTQAASSRTDALYLPMGESLLIDIGAYRRASVSGALWQDTHNNGRYAAGNPPLADTEVTLLRDDEAILATRTDENGAYMFDDLSPGYYALRVTLPEGFRFSRTVQAQGRYSRMPQTDKTAGDTDSFYLGNGEVLSAMDIGAVNTGHVTGSVLNGKDGKGLAGVQVTLLREGEAPRTQQTDAEGKYHFEAVRPGAALVSFESPDGWTLAPGTEETADIDVAQGGVQSLPARECLPEALMEGALWLDANANGAWDEEESPLLGVDVTLYRIDGEERARHADTRTDTNGYYVFDKLLPGVYALELQLPEGMLLYDESGLLPIALEMGEIVEHTLPAYIGSALSGLVWEDIDFNGLISAGEPAIKGAEVQLLDAEGVVLQRMETDDDGAYRFADVPPGTCRLRFTLPSGYIFTSPAESGSAAPQSDDGTGESAWITLSMGDVRTNLHAGAIRSARVGDLVWLDANGNGLQDTEEAGIVGMAVRLWRVNEDGEEVFIAETRTDKNGRYRFDAVRPGAYYIAFAPGEAYIPTRPVSGLPQINSKLPWHSAPIVTTEPFLLTSGKHELTMDAGFVMPEMAEAFGWQAREGGAIAEGAAIEDTP